MRKAMIGDNASPLESPEHLYTQYCRGELDRDQFALALEATAKRIARQVATGGIGNQRQDFVEDVLSTLFARRPKSGPRIDDYSPERGRIESWMTSVLGNAWKDILRKNKRRREINLSADDQMNWVADHRTVQPTFPELSPNDLDQIDKWPPRYQLVGMILGGLFIALPEDKWESIVTTYEVQHKTILPRPFPPTDIVGLSSPNELYEPLANLLELSRENMLQVVKRTRDRLKCLLVIQELSDI